MSNWTVQDMPRQNGRIVLVTGANSGIGFEIALAFAQKGARVIMACRNMEKGQAAYDEIRSQEPDADLDLRRLDLSSLESVRTFSESVLDDYTRLHVLVNNAGLMAIPRWETADGFEMQFGVNHLGHFALTGLLLPLLQNTPGSRVVTVSSMVSMIGKINFDDLQGEKNYTRYGAYGQSKLANILFALELQRRFDNAGIKSLSLPAHPGYSATNLQSTSTGHSGSTTEQVLYRVLNRVAAQSSAMGALPELFAAASPDARPGVFYGPQNFHMRGYPREVNPPKAALNEATAQRLWQVSEELTGVTYNFAAQDEVKSVN